MIIDKRLRDLLHLLEVYLKRLDFRSAFGHGLELEVKAGVQAVDYLGNFVGPVAELQQLIGIVKRTGSSFCRLGGPFGDFCAEIPVGQVNNGDAENLREFEEVADFGFGGTVFIGGDIAPVETYAQSEFFLAEVEFLPQCPDVLVEIHGRLMVVVRIAPLLLYGHVLEVFDKNSVSFHE